MTTWQKIAIGILAAIVWALAVWVGYQIPALLSDMANAKLAAAGILGGIGIHGLSSHFSQAGANKITPQINSQEQKP